MSYKTMNDIYRDGSDHEACSICGFCKHCGDCECQQACAERKDKRIKELHTALSDLLLVAERCDSWESFPSNALDAAYKVLERDIE